MIRIKAVSPHTMSYSPISMTYMYMYMDTDQTGDKCSILYCTDRNIGYTTLYFTSAYFAHLRYTHLFHPTGNRRRPCYR